MQATQESEVWRVYGRSHPKRNVSSSSKSSTSSGSGTHHTTHKLPLCIRKVRHETHKLPEFENLKQAALDRFARDIFFVQEGLRTAHLVDAVHISGENVQRFATALGKGNKGANAELILLHESTTQQTFVVNRQRLMTIGQSVRKGEGCCMKQHWVRVSTGRPEIMESMPQYLVDTMSKIWDLIETIVCKDGEPLPVVQLAALLPQDMNPQRSMVAFAGMALCYPVIYVLDCDDPNEECTQAKGLRNQPLWLVQMVLEGVDPRNDHILMQFTAPANLFALDDEDKDDLETTLPTLAALRSCITPIMYRALDDSSDTLQSLWKDMEVTADGPYSFERLAL